MNQGMPATNHRNANVDSPRATKKLQERGTPRQYPLEMLQVLGGMESRRNVLPELEKVSSTSVRGTLHLPDTRRTHQITSSEKNMAFGDDSDDSSLSSNASGSNQTSENGENAVSTKGGAVSFGQGPNGQGRSREWRGRSRRDQQRQRRCAPDRYLNYSYPFQIKYTPHNLLNGSKWDPLSQEIWTKFIRAQQSSETFEKKMNLWRYLFITIKTIFPRYGLYVVGSTMSGFGLDTSDMDLCLYVRPEDPNELRSHEIVHLNCIFAFIKTFDPSAVLITAKVPIVKFTDSRTGLQVDLNCNNIVGIRNTSLLHCYSRLDWRVRPLVVIAKLWAQAHNINDARQSTLSSYSLTLMVIHFLQCGTNPSVLPCIRCDCVWEGRHRPANRTSLGELFLQMLRYYAEFPYTRLAISVRVGAALPIAECRAARTHKNEASQWKLLCVEEPFDLTNTARSVYDPNSFQKIVDVFRESYKRLSNGLRLTDAWPVPAR